MLNSPTQLFYSLLLPILFAFSLSLAADPDTAVSIPASETATDTKARQVTIIASTTAVNNNSDITQPESASSEESLQIASMVATTAATTVTAVEVKALSHAEQLELFTQQLKAFKVTKEDADDYFEMLRNEVRLRLWQFDMALVAANSVDDKVLIDPALLEADHPGFPKKMYQLPADVDTVQDLYIDLVDLYSARTGALELVSSERHRRAVGTALMGMQELSAEKDLIKAAIRYQVLRFPQAYQQIKSMLSQAPITLLWLVIQFILAIMLFRWWRDWLPSTLQRMRDGLLAIRPRTQEILSRLRGLWYIDQVRTPLEWLLLWTFMFGLLQFDGIDFIRDTGLIVMRWIMFAWFSVALLNAFAARGAGGLAGDAATLRLKTMRLIANWLMLLGLSLDLVGNLVGNAALINWIWRVFALLAFPLVFRLLDLWHMELYARLQREGEPDIPEQEYAAQRGFKRWIGTAKVGGLLITSWLRSVLLKRIAQFDPAAGRNISDDKTNDNDADTTKGLTGDLRNSLIKGYESYSKYSRLERRQLVDRINAQESGLVNIIGERGIGKGQFLRQIADAHDYNSIFIDCQRGGFDEVTTEFIRQLGLTEANPSDEAINAVISERNIHYVAINNLHLLARPVMGGFTELAKLSHLFTRVHTPLLWVISIDRYAHHFIAQAQTDYVSESNIQLRSWTEEQIGEFIENSCKTAEITPDFSNVRVPRQYMDTAEDIIEERNQAGIYAMISSLSRGNPSIAIRLFADCLQRNDKAGYDVTLPANLDAQTLENASITMLLILRVIAQSELITLEDIIDNLRFDPPVIKTNLHFAVMAGWVEHRNGLYRITWPWFRTITRILSRKNLLAGVREDIS
ncbi:MAG: hypothetical protein ACJAYG_000211 [Oceanicoccus sp.]|jgi:hypothetical protein